MIGVHPNKPLIKELICKLHDKMSTRMGNKINVQSFNHPSTLLRPCFCNSGKPKTTYSCVDIEIFRERGKENQ